MTVWDINYSTTKRYRKYHRFGTMTLGEFTRLREVLPKSWVYMFGVDFIIRDKRIDVLMRDHGKCAACDIKATHVHVEDNYHSMMDVSRWAVIPPPLAFGNPFYAHVNLYADKTSNEWGGSGEIQLTIDHVRPRSSGGSNHVDNLVTLCETCNQKKGSDPDWIQDLPKNKHGQLISRPHRQKGFSKHV